MHYLWDCSEDLYAVPVNIALKGNMQYLWALVQNEVCMHHMRDWSEDLYAVPVNNALEDNMQYLWAVVQMK